MRIGIDDMVAEVGVRRVLVTIAMVLLVSVSAGGLVSSAPARAEGCSVVTEQVRLQQPDGSRLPDCRAYEQVSPVDKNNVDAIGSVGLVQAAGSGGAVSFFAEAPFPPDTIFPLTEGSGYAPSYLGVRSAGGADWGTQGMEALGPPGSTEKVLGATPDLARTIIEVGNREPDSHCEPLREVCGGGSNINAFLGSTASGSFQFLADLGSQELGFADATPGGSRVLFELDAKLVPGAGDGVNLYEWDESKPPGKQISLAGVLPDGLAPNEGSFAGPGGPAVGRTPPLESKWHFYTQHTISEDGSRIFFSDIETGIIYMREPEVKRTVQVSGGGGPAFWRAATRDGSYVFYTEGQELYRFNVARFEGSVKSEPEALAESREQLTMGAEGLFGVLGISENDGSYAYFVAPGVLATNSNGEGSTAETGAANLYEWHDGTITFIVGLPSDEEADWRSWENAESESGGPGGGGMSSRVTPDGTAVLFSSRAARGGYNNNGLTEFYLYSAGQPPSAVNPICVSCNPQGTSATGTVFNKDRLTDTNEDVTLIPTQRNAFLTRNLSDSGRRVFFESSEGLVPGDGNLQTDVYEWEADGEGSCESASQDDGCLFLISAGQSSQHSYFGDASADGNDVFFFTRQSLVGQDHDNNLDLYDARVDGGILVQNPSAAVAAPCGDEASCRGASSSSAPASVFGVPSSTTFSGAGNLASPVGPPVLARVVVVSKKRTGAQIRAVRLAKALGACRSKPKARRKGCEATARKRYGSSKAKVRKSSRGVVGHE